MSLSREFVSFLRQHDALEAFRKNVDQQMIEDESYSPKDWIDSAFVWITTEEGVTFWADISYAWDETLEEKDLL